MKRLPFKKHSSIGRRVTKAPGGGLIKAARKYAKHGGYVKTSVQ